jgi:hypothetical protein
MTDAEIKKALECCIKSHHFADCFKNKCPCVSEDGCAVGKETLYPYALDLINRQQAEIERLQKENNQFADIGKMYSEIKSEAIKEYREKAAIKLAENARSDYWHWIDDTLYEVEKEMKGES